MLAHGRDPFFPPWSDTVQVNYRHAGARRAMTAELARIAGWCDGVRCDMAMLLQPDVFLRTWGERALPADGTPPVDEPFWPEAMRTVRRARPDFLFAAEVYWDREWELQQAGFDFTYDKRLYDRLRAGAAPPVREHLRAAPEFQDRSLRFLENHDEPRAAAVFAPEVHRAAAVVTFLVPGMHLIQEGQLEGRKIHVSVHLGRRAPEPPDAQLAAFYERLLACLRRPEVDRRSVAPARHHAGLGRQRQRGWIHRDLLVRGGAPSGRRGQLRPHGRPVLRAPGSPRHRRPPGQPGRSRWVTPTTSATAAPWRAGGSSWTCPRGATTSSRFASVDRRPSSSLTSLRRRLRGPPRAPPGPAAGWRW